MTNQELLEQALAGPMEAYAYTAPWTRRRSTQRLERDLLAALRVDCECDDGYECTIHRRREELRWALQIRKGLERQPEPDYEAGAAALEAMI